MQPMSKIEGQASIPVGGATQLVYAKKSGNTLYSNYSEVQSKLSGAAQITFGIPLIVINSILLGTDGAYFQTVNIVGHGIWGGVLLIVSGSVGVAASTRKKKCLAISYMILCILSALLSIPAIIFAGYGVANEFECRLYRAQRKICTRYGWEFAESFSILMLVFAVLGGISAIWGSTLCCKAAACCSDDNLELVPMQIITANQKILPADSTIDYPKPSAVEGYEKLHRETSDEDYDEIKDDDVKDDLDLDNSGYEKNLQLEANKGNDNMQQSNYEKCNLVGLREDLLENSGVTDSDKLMDNREAGDDYVRYEKPVNDYLTLEAEKDFQSQL